VSDVPAGADRAHGDLPPERGQDRPSGAGRAAGHYGPLRVLRDAKSDGRALILYSRDEQPRHD
jgi:hypothetical protein